MRDRGVPAVIYPWDTYVVFPGVTFTYLPVYYTCT